MEVQLLNSGNGTTTKKFKLTDNFITKYSSIQPPFGYSGLGEFTFYDKYSRVKEDGANERWYETIQRVVEGTYTLQKIWIESNGLGWNALQAQKSAQEMYDRMFNMKFLPPGRGLWAMGTDIIYKKGLFESLNNCAFISTLDIKDNPTLPFCFLMNMSMLGVGVGFDIRGEGKLLIKGDDTNRESYTYSIPDDREGWVQSLKLLIESYVYGTQPVYFDYSLLRAKGEPIKTFGGVSSGPEPLQQMHNDIRVILNSIRGEVLMGRQIVDIMNLIGRCVVSGNVRRSSEIVFGEVDDVDYLELKNYDKNPDRRSFGWVSNNSVFVQVGDNYTDAAERTKLNGEPGYAWLKNMQDYGRMIDPPNHKDWRVTGGNPCVVGGTLVQVVGEGPVRIDELSKREKSFHVYSANVKGGLTINKAIAFKTKENAETLKLKFATGKELICTPDHRIGINDKKGNCVWKEAKDISMGDCVIAFQRIKKGYQYLRVKTSMETAYTPEHIKIANYFIGDSFGKHVHHKNNNTFDNNPVNLEVLEIGKHCKISNVGHEPYCTNSQENGRFIGKTGRKNKSYSSIPAPEYLLTRNNLGGSTKIVSIEEGSVEDVYDLIVENDHSFFANDILIHNCLEQSLESGEMCNLVETFIDRHENIDDYLRTLKFAYLYAKTITLGKTAWPETNRIILRNRRIGCSISGIAQFIQSRGIESLREWTDKGYNTIQHWDEVYSSWLAIPRSIKTTSIKPSGTVSLLAGATPGVHFPISRFYIRRVRLAKNSPLLEPLIKAGHHVEDDVVDTHSKVVEFYIDAGEGVRTLNDVSMYEQLNLAAFMQRYWADNQVSCTITFKPHEANNIKDALDFYQYQLKGISFLPDDTSSYEQMPYESIDEETYNDKIKGIRSIDFSSVRNNIADLERFCSGDTCEITSEISIRKSEG